jgi:uncharacterized protein
MRLTVLQKTSPWFSDGLRFTCQQCGNCCSGGPGFVWITRQEIANLAKHLGLTRGQVLRRYCRRVGRQYALKEVWHPPHGYDCIFIREIEGENGSGPKRICSIYEARPLQCRTWPFWEGNLSSGEAWQRAAKHCPGMNQGEFFDRKRIEELQAAREWPRKAPTS